MLSREYKKYKRKKKIKKILIVAIITIAAILLINKIFFSEDSLGKTIETISQRLTVKTVKIVPSEMEEYSSDIFSVKSCVDIEIIGELLQISNPKQKVCREACGIREMEYVSNDCEKNTLVCYCLK